MGWKPGSGRTLAIAFVALLAAACGSSASPTPSANVGGISQAAASSQAAPVGQGGQQGGQGTANLCAALTQAQVDAAGGGSLAAGVLQNDGQQCLWQNQTNASISLSLDDSGSTYEDTCSVSDPSVVKVGGIGDGACFLVAGNIGTSLHFKKGSHSYSVAVQRIDVTVDQVEVFEKTLAEAAVAKL